MDLMQKLFLCFAASVVISNVSAEQELQGVSYVENQLITGNPNPYAEASDWGMCSAAYSAVAEIYSSDMPAMSKRASEMANGAKVPILMIFILKSSEGDEDGIADRFASAMAMGKVSMESMTETASTRLAADFEIMNADGDGEQWFTNLAETVSICSQNSAGQQSYIDAWRDLATSGLVTLPEE